MHTSAVRVIARRQRPFLRRNSHSFKLPNASQSLRPARQNVAWTPVRRLNIHEYQAQDLFRQFKVPCPDGVVARSPSEAKQAAADLGGVDLVVKAQVLAGGRGKGKFSNGFQGGVHLCNSPEKVAEVATKMLGQQLVTKQTGHLGKPCHSVLVAKRLFLRREAYFAILLDRESAGPVMVGSPQGGMDIEAVAAQSPELIFKEHIDLQKGPTAAQLRRLAVNMGFEHETYTTPVCMEAMKCLYDLFLAKDCTQVEINPLAETHDNHVLCLDAKLNFDDNAMFRQPDMLALRDTSQMDPREVRAETVGLNYISLDGNIGCLVNGAGLAMATMDVIKIHGGEPANFLDLGGGANEAQVAEAFNLLNSDESVKAILVNIFGGIMRCDVIALGLIRAATDVGLKKPIVVRLAGTKVKEARQLIEDSGLRMLSSEDLSDAAQKVVRVTEIVEMAADANVKVSFELPL